MISAIYNFALTTGANRVIRGARIEHVCGDPALSHEKDYAFGMRIAYHGPRRKDVAYTYYADIVELARAADCLVVTCPLTEEMVMTLMAAEPR